MKIDMLEVKKDRLKEVNRQLKTNLIGNWKNSTWENRVLLKIEKQTLLQEIKDIESKRGVINE